MKLPRTYLIPGLGADRRLFRGLEEAGMEFEVLEFIDPKPQESLAEYGARMAQRIDPNEPFLLGGVSLGGMISMEVAKHVQPEKLILISSVKTSREFPFYFRAFRYLPVQRAIPANWLRLLAPRNPFKMEAYKRKILLDMRREMDPRFIKWAINAAVQWRNAEVPDQIIHLHGTRDLMFPGILLGKRTKLPRGSHVMVLNRAEEVRDALHQALRMETE